MKNDVHPQHAELVAYLDGELEEKESGKVRRHLAECALCAAERDRLCEISARIGKLVGTANVLPEPEQRTELRRKLAFEGRPGANRETAAGKTMRRFGWGMALAAAIATALLFVPRRSTPVNSEGATVAATMPKVHAQTASLDVNGESFMALPYSNPDLPMNAPRIVEMQVPLSSLTAAGITVEPGPNAAPDRTVRANVLLGLDGQPLGLHVLAAD